MTGAHPLGPAGGGAVRLAWTVAVGLTGAATTARRDVN
jgi:hypothetical protein